MKEEIEDLKEYVTVLQRDILKLKGWIVVIVILVAVDAVLLYLHTI